MSKKTVLSLSALALAMASTSASAVTIDALNDTKFTFGGYVKSDFMFSNYDNGAPSSGHISRNFYVPGTIYGDSNNAKEAVDFNIRESRFNFGSQTDVDGHKVQTLIEFDFMVTSGGNERVSNSYVPRLRQVFVSVDNWLVGQAWSTFQNPGALPEALDFVGAAEGTPFVRQTQIRYTNGGLQLAVENPETTLTTATGGREVIGTGTYVPDFVARYNFKAGDSAFTIAGLGRQLSKKQGGIDSTKFGYAVSGTAVVPLGMATIKAGANYGDGAGRYIALNFANGGYVDGNGKIQSIKSTSGYASLQLRWNEKWRSNVTVSAFQADDTGIAMANKKAMSGNVNLLYSPIKTLTIGAELFTARNEREDKSKGDLNRVIFSVKYVL
ncbi:DcaP family trimeric outer membrane transporter [Paraferrimonas sedimenticola]|uniref:Porin n=1 Tax=Paraferrimonas sedimenticola TaxID=375674 RepID=A0AA37W2Q2_9GAMM|nr:DcaP family trimeric outer membrane transporter [Paraferrimonas sedimenticola]GLP97963.1 hypothetical protein GCM10007895_32700 [Paraferrimonas sedimenticola]